VENIASFRLAGAVDGYLNVEGTVRPVAAAAGPSSSGAAVAGEREKRKEEEAVRVDVEFTAFSLKIGVLPALKIPLGWANPTVGHPCWHPPTRLLPRLRAGACFILHAVQGHVKKQLMTLFY
jgi:hypothetical protein